MFETPPQNRFSALWRNGKFRRMLAVSGYFSFVFFLPYLFDDPALILLLPSGVAFLWLIFFLRDPSGGRSLSERLEMKRIAAGQPIKIALAIISAVVVTVIASEFTKCGLDFLGIPYQTDQELLRMLKRSSGMTEKIFIGVIVAILAPAGEEIVFRKIIFDLFRPAGLVSAVVLTSLLFAALHFYLAGILALGLFGVILQLLFLKTGNLCCSIQVHAAFNLLAFIGALLTAE